MIPLHRTHSMLTRGALGRTGSLLLVATIVVVAACGGKSEAQQATDELNLGLAASSAGDNEAAKAHYLACLKHNPQNQFCIYNVGVLAMQAGNTLEAENDYRLALLIDPDFASAAFNLAYIQSRAGNDVATREAIELYRHFVQLRPTEAGGHLNLGLLLIKTGDVTNGNAEITLAKTLDPSITVPPQPSPAASPAPARTPDLSPSPLPS